MIRSEPRKKDEMGGGEGEFGEQQQQQHGWKANREGGDGAYVVALTNAIHRWTRRPGSPGQSYGCYFILLVHALVSVLLFPGCRKGKHAYQNL